MKTLITIMEVIGCMAHWAVRQHPYGRPEGLFEVTDTLTTAAAAWPDGVSSLPMWRIEDDEEVRRWLHATLHEHPVLKLWNTPRSGHDRQMVFSSRYDSPAPEDNFIDIDALLMNVARQVMQTALIEKAADAAHVDHTSPDGINCAVSHGVSVPWPDPTDEMLVDPIFEAIWQTIKSWDVNVPGAYSGYSGATGNHARAILEAVRRVP